MPPPPLIDLSKIPQQQQQQHHSSHYHNASTTTTTTTAGAANNGQGVSPRPSSLQGCVAMRVLSFNAWGIFNSKHRQARLAHFAATKLRFFDIICLQEQFGKDDFYLMMHAYQQSAKYDAMNGVEGGHAMETFHAAVAAAAAAGSPTLAPSGSGGFSHPSSGDGLSLTLRGGERLATAVSSSSSLYPTFYAARFPSSFIGSGLTILSRYEILSTQFFCFPSQGYPERVLHGDYFARKGVALVKVRVPMPSGSGGGSGATPTFFVSGATAAASSSSYSTPENSNSPRIPFMEVNVYTTHLVAQYQKYSQLGSYEAETYAAHRLSQIHSLASFIASTSRPGDALIITGDFNASPTSPEISLLLALCHRQGISLVRTVVPDDATNFTYSHQNMFNSDATGYFKMLNMQEDLPVQLDHIFVSLPLWAANQSPHHNNNNNSNNNNMSAGGNTSGSGSGAVQSTLQSSASGIVTGGGAVLTPQSTYGGGGGAGGRHAGAGSNAATGTPGLTHRYHHGSAAAVSVAAAATPHTPSTAQCPWTAAMAMMNPNAPSSVVGGGAVVGLAPLLLPSELVSPAHTRHNQELCVGSVVFTSNSDVPLESATKFAAMLTQQPQQNPRHISSSNNNKSMNVSNLNMRGPYTIWSVLDSQQQQQHQQPFGNHDASTSIPFDPRTPLTTTTTAASRSGASSSTAATTHCALSDHYGVAACVVVSPAPPPLPTDADQVGLLPALLVDVSQHRRAIDFAASVLQRRGVEQSAQDEKRLYRIAIGCVMLPIVAALLTAWMGKFGSQNSFQTVLDVLQWCVIDVLCDGIFLSHVGMFVLGMLAMLCVLLGKLHRGNDVVVMGQQVLDLKASPTTASGETMLM